MAIATLEYKKHGSVTDNLYATTDGVVSNCGAVDMISVPGVLKTGPLATAMAEAASANDVDEAIVEMVGYTANASYKVYGIGHDADIFATDLITSAGTWTKVHSISNSNRAITTFGTNLYACMNNKLVKYDGTTWTDAFKTLSSTSAYVTMLNFGGKLNVINGRYVDTLDADGSTWTAPALTLPLGTSTSTGGAIQWNEKIAILGTNALYIWNGSSATYTSAFALAESCVALANHENTLLIFGESGMIYEFNGARVTPLLRIPHVGGTNRTTKASVAISRGSILYCQGRTYFGLSSYTTNTEFRSGLWSIGRATSSDPLTLQCEVIPTVTGGGYGGANDAVTALFIYNTSSGTGAADVPTMIAWAKNWNSGSAKTYGVDWLDWDKSPASGAFVEYPMYNLSHNARPLGIKLDYESIAGDFNGTADTIVVKYRIDADDSYTTLATIDKLSVDGRWQGLEIPFENISPVDRLQIRLDFTCGTASADIHFIHGWRLRYKTSDNVRLQ